MSSYINRYTALLTFTTILIAALLFGAGGPVLGQGPDPEPTLGGDSAADYLARATHFAYTVFDTPAAIADATAAINLDPALLDAYILRGQQFLWMSMPVQAAADFNEALKLDPDSTAALVGRAEALFFNPFLGADIALAQADLNRALDLDSDNAAALTLLGLLAFNVALEIDEADALFARAIEADPAYARAYMERATAQALRGRGSAEALSNIQQAADLWGDSPFGVNARAIWLLDTGDTEAGWDEYQRGIAQFPHFPLLYSWASARAGDISDQLALISAAVDLAPESPILLLARGTLYGNNREFDLAVADFNRALELAPDYLHPHYLLTNLYLSPTYRDCEQAIVHFDQTMGGVMDWTGLDQYHRNIEFQLESICAQPDDGSGWITVDNPLLEAGAEITVPGIIIFELLQAPGSTASATLCTTGTMATVLQSVQVEVDGPVYVEIECDGGTGWRLESDLVQP